LLLCVQFECFAVASQTLIISNGFPQFGVYIDSARMSFQNLEFWQHWSWSYISWWM